MDTQDATSNNSIEMSVKEEETLNDEELLDRRNKRQELHCWNKMNYLNHMIRKYEVELYQRRNGSQKLQNEIKEKIMNTN